MITSRGRRPAKMPGLGSRPGGAMRAPCGNLQLSGLRTPQDFCTASIYRRRGSGSCVNPALERSAKWFKNSSLKCTSALGFHAVHLPCIIFGYPLVLHASSFCPERSEMPFSLQLLQQPVGLRPRDMGQLSNFSP